MMDKKLQDIWRQNQIHKSHIKHLNYSHIKNYNQMKPRQIIWHLLHNIDKIPTCIECNNQVKWSTKSDYQNYCSVKCSNSSDNIKNKKKQTLIKNYGVDNPNKSEKIKNKIRKTKIILYDNENYNNRKKAQQTCLERYGVDHNFKNKKIQEKRQQTLIKNYGVKNPSQSKEIQEKIRQTNLERYGVENPTYKHLTENTIDILDNKNRFIKFIKEKTITQIAEELNVVYSTIQKKIQNENLYEYILSDFSNSPSYLETEMKNFLKNIDFIQNDRQIIFPLELDFYLPEHNLAIEMNGDYWHSDKYKDKMYHQNKFLKCQKNNIQLIQISESDWNNKQNIIKAMVSNKLGLNPNKIGGRKCLVWPLKDAKSFFNDNHIQGYRPAKICYGLFYQGEVLMAMSFGKPRYNKNYEWEIIRLGTKLGWNVSGGVSRLFKQFMKDHSPSSVISYSSNDYGTGNVYRQLGFEFSHVAVPNYKWMNGNIELTRYQCQKHKLNKLLGESFDKDISEKSNMENNGYLRVFDSGNNVWVMSLDKYNNEPFK